MSMSGVETISAFEKETLLAAIKNDAQGRLSHAPSYLLYLTLDSPRPSLAAVTQLVLRELASSDAACAETWAREWGKVVVAVKPDESLSCRLLPADDPEAKYYVPVQTAAAIPIEELVGDVACGSLGTLLLNRASKTIEAFLIAYVHMVDQFIWEMYRTRLAERHETSSPALYAEVVDAVRQQGFRLQLASEDEILLTKKLDSRVSVRLYGSGVNKQVARVMGAVQFSSLPFAPASEPVLAGQVDKQTGVSLTDAISVTRSFLLGEPRVVGEVTFGKELHIGHILALAWADVLRRSVASQYPITLVNNNTGPRAAGALVAVSKKLNLSLPEAAVLLQAGEISLPMIVDAYRNREVAGELLDEAISLLDSGKYDIFSAVTRSIQPSFRQAGFFVEVVAESDLLPQGRDIVQALKPSWRGTGFMFSLLGKSLKVLESGARLTSQGKHMATMAALSSRLQVDQVSPELIFVDNTVLTATSVSINKRNRGTFGGASMVYGAGVGINGLLATGSNGVALPWSQVLKYFRKLSPNDLSAALRYLVLHRPGTVMDKDSVNLDTFFYDYQDNQSFVQDVFLCHEELRQYQQRVVEELRELAAKQSSMTLMGRPRAQDMLDNISCWKERAETISSQEITRMMRRVRVLRDEDEIALAVGRQGYRGQEAEVRICEYVNGPRGLAMRKNYHKGLLDRLLVLSQQIISVTPADYQVFSSTVETCLTRLGFVPESLVVKPRSRQRVGQRI